MKTFILLLSISLPVIIFSQDVHSLGEGESSNEVSMKEVSGKNIDGVYRYYKEGADEPYSGVLYSSFPNGQTDSWQEYKEGVGQGKWINYYKNGKIKEIGNYENNLVQGSIKKYYENGNLKAEGTYKDWRIKVGVWTYYNSDGIPTDTVDYGQKGSLEEVQEYYERGEISQRWYVSIMRKNGF
jgi:antitoxin component YwqK of YwqJK toxin-antitoxin module